MLNIISGKVKGYTRKADDGNEITREFCQECGSPLFTRLPSNPQFIFIKAGSLDDPTCVKPIYQVWTEEAVPWAHIDENITSYPQNPTPLGDDVTPPITILKKQAEILETQTNGTLKGLVWQVIAANKISLRLDLLAQNLDNYSVTLL